MKKKEVFIISLFILPVIAVLVLSRTSWGTDVDNYIVMIGEGEGEPLFRALTQPVYRLSGSEILALNLMVLISLTWKMFYSLRIMGLAAFLVFPVLLPDIIAKDFGTIRQGLAIAVLLPIMFFKFNNIRSQFLLNIFCVFLASLFHWSAIIMAIVHYSLLCFSRQNWLFVFLVFSLALMSISLPFVVDVVVNLIPYDLYSYKIERYYSYYDPYAVNGLLSAFFTLVEMLALLGVLIFTKKSVEVNGVTLYRADVARYVFLVKCSIIFLAAPQLARGLNLVNYFSTFYVGLFLFSTKKIPVYLLYCLLVVMAILSSAVYISRYPNEFSVW